MAVEFLNSTNIMDMHTSHFFCEDQKVMFMAETLCFFMEHPEYQKYLREDGEFEQVHHHTIVRFIKQAKLFAEKNQEDDEWEVTKT